MTINVVLFTVDGMIQASDRRMTTVPGRLVDDQSNKAVVVRTKDGLFAATFFGIGRVRNERMDLWLSSVMAKEGVPEMPIVDGLQIIASRASAFFNSFRTADKRHGFVISGWVFRDQPQPRVWLVSNCAGADGQRLPVASHSFTVHAEDVGALGRKAEFRAYGIFDGIALDELRQFEGILEGPAGVDGIEHGIVDLIGAAANKPASGGGIGKEVLCVALSPDGRARVTVYGGAGAESYAPLFVWNQGANNIIAGDARISDSGDFAFRFGETVLVGSRSNTPSSSGEETTKAQFRVQLTHAKYADNDPPEKDSLVIVECMPISERARRMMAQIPGRNSQLT